MTQPDSPSGLQCANCHHALDATDKFCRECGLPTLRQAEAVRAVPQHSPGLPSAVTEQAPDPQPFVRSATDATSPSEPEAELTTSGLVRVTSPTLATQMALSTVVMVVLILAFMAAGITLLVLAFRG
ncbi:MAG: zinc ribbon domain-containing protein [Anaerolineales bacterium]|nr:zinc ribbon domain-containing protein [Anaerolineales bacterium]